MDIQQIVDGINREASEDFTEDEIVEFFRTLSDIRDSGTVNMFGAADLLVTEFQINRFSAKIILRSWMENFDDMDSII